MKKIVILGSTGSIGASTLDIVSRFSDHFSVAGLTAGHNDRKLEEQIRAHRPKVVALASESAASRLRSRLNGQPVEVLSGEEGLCTVASETDCDLVISAIVGGAGLTPTMAAIRAGRHVALANKEPMVMVGHLMQEEAHRHGTRIFPVDSEHSAIFQSLEGHRREDVRRIVLTASGGPFWDWPLEKIQVVTVEQALNHPNWKMGDKITIDSATLMNKGLEVIEARWLFDIEPTQINIVIHRESIIHSLVEYRDGSVMAQLGLPDMRTPISYAMNYPERVPLDPPLLDLGKIGQLNFSPPDFDKFPCARLAYDALREGGGLPAALNAANEIAVEAFLANEIAFLDIPKIIEETMSAYTPKSLSTVEDALDTDRWAREKAAMLRKAFVS